MPPRTRTTTNRTPVKKRAEHELDDALSVVDQLADDAESVEAPKEYPPGVPALKTLLAIRPRSRRAEFKRRYAEVAELNVKVKALQAEATKHKSGSNERYAADLRVWAEMDDMLDIVDKALRLAAVDPEAYAAWSDEVSDDDLMLTFNVYQQRTQPGEALSSTS